MLNVEKLHFYQVICCNFIHFFASVIVSRLQGHLISSPVQDKKASGTGCNKGVSFLLFIILSHLKKNSIGIVIK